MLVQIALIILELIVALILLITLFACCGCIDQKILSNSLYKVSAFLSGAWLIYNFPKAFVAITCVGILAIAISKSDLQSITLAKNVNYFTQSQTHSS